MFSGLVQAQSSIIKVVKSKDLLRIWIKKPSQFSSLKEGDSICVDGVCLTLEKFDKQKMLFALAPETLKITKWQATQLQNKKCNLEKSISLNEALGGHLLTGHVDGLARVMSVKTKGESRIIQVKVPAKYKKSFWKKGYIALNGVSLTINEIKGDLIEVCIVPKTLKMTNLGTLKKGDYLNFEVDYFTRIFMKNLHLFLKNLKA